MLEADRIDDRTAPIVEKGRSGAEDEMIQHQIIRADEVRRPFFTSVNLWFE